MKKRAVRLSTIDNPYDPFDQFEQWFLYDVGKGYNSCSLLARFAHTSSMLSDYENEQEVERAIDEIIAHDFTGMFTKVVRESEEKDESA